jgi:hypothetical protein
VVAVVAALADGLIQRWSVSLARAKCSSCKCSFTCYPPGIYPHRQFQLDVVAQAVAQVAFGEKSAAEAALWAHASATSVRRWTRWVAEVAQPAELLAVAARNYSGTVPGEGVSSAPSGTAAARVLVALEQLGAALVRRGISLAQRTGLARVLGWQHASHGDVVGLVSGVRHLSPALALEGASG